jgi:hypothetical protein
MWMLAAGLLTTAWKMDGHYNSGVFPLRLADRTHILNSNRSVRHACALEAGWHWLSGQRVAGQLHAVQHHLCHGNGIFRAGSLGI